MIQALQGLQALLEPLERQAQCQDLQVQLVELVLLEPQAILVQQDLLVRQVQQVPQVRQDQAVLLVQLERQVLLARQALMQLHCQAYLC